jgi:hypothetical protein
MTEDLLKIFLQQGLLGAIVIVLGVVLYRRDKELLDEKNNRIEDARAFNQLAMSLQERVIVAVDRLSDLVAVLEKREAAREYQDAVRGHRRAE